MPNAVKNTAGEVAKHGLAATGSMYATNLFAEHILLHGGGTTEVFANLGSGVSDGLDMTDLWDIFDFSLTIFFKIYLYNFIWRFV